MSTRCVLMVDPLNYTPYYDLNLCDALIAHGRQVEWLTSPYMFETIYPPSSVPVKNLFLRFATALMHRLQWIRGIPMMRGGIKAMSYPIDLMRLALLIGAPITLAVCDEDRARSSDSRT